MTKNQIDYQRAIEDQRHNLEAEKELAAKAEEHRAKAQLTDWQALQSKVMTFPQLLQSLADWQGTKVRTLKDIAQTFSALNSN